MFYTNDQELINSNVLHLFKNLPTRRAALNALTHIKGKPGLGGQPRTPVVRFSVRAHVLQKYILETLPLQIVETLKDHKILSNIDFDLQMTPGFYIAKK